MTHSRLDPFVVLLATVPACFSPNVADESSTDGVDSSSSGSVTEDSSGDGGPTDGGPSSAEESDGPADVTDGVSPECDESEVPSSCPADKPFCVAEACVDCSDAPVGACEALDPANPACDDASGTCSPCSSHEQCASGACRMTTGECVPTDHAVFVDRDADNCAGADGTPRLPFCTIAAALDVVEAQPANTAWLIEITGSAAPYQESLEVEGGAPVIVFSANESQFVPRLESSEGTVLGVSSLSSSGGPPEVYIDGITIDGDVSCAGDGSHLELNGITAEDVRVDNRCNTLITDSVLVRLHSTDNATVVARSVSFEGSFGVISIDRGSVEVHDSTLIEIATNGIFGIEVIDGDFELSNSLVLADYQMIFLEGESTVEVNYSTIRSFLSPEAYGTGQVFVCTMEDGTRAVRVSNSLLYGLNYSYCDFTLENSVVSLYSAGSEEDLETFADIEGVDVITPESYSAMFVADRDHHVLNGSFAAGVADWNEGDPTVDLDGDPRPAGPGTSDYAGADVP